MYLSFIKQIRKKSFKTHVQISELDFNTQPEPFNALTH